MSPFTNDQNYGLVAVLSVILGCSRAGHFVETCKHIKLLILMILQLNNGMLKPLRPSDLTVHWMTILNRHGVILKMY